MDQRTDERKILGINFYVGDVQGVFERLSRGGLLVYLPLRRLRMLRRMKSTGMPS